MLRSVKILPVTFSVMLLAACTERIDVELDSSFTRLVVDGSISTDTTVQQVKLAKTADYFVNEPLEPVTGAIVSITDGTNVIILAENPADQGTYLTDSTVYGVPGLTYTLTISNVDVNSDGVTETYTASSEMRFVQPPDSIQVIYMNQFYTWLWDVRTFAQDPPDSRDFYMFRVLRNGKQLKDTITEVGFSSDEYYNGWYIKGETVSYLLEENPSEALKDGDTITLETIAITGEYYQYLVDVMMEAHGSDPFGGQPANISTNLNNNAVGYFASYSIARTSTIWRQQK
jgi:hypothetical protein